MVGAWQQGIVRSVALIGALAILVPLAAHGEGAKKPVRSEADLPRFTYAIAGKASDLLQADRATFDTFAQKVLVDVNATLDGYDVQDHAALRAILNEKASILTLEGENQAALDLVRQIRELEDKPDAKLTSGLRLEAILKARIQTGQAGGDAYAAAFKQIYGDAIKGLPYDLVGNVLKEAKEGVEISSPTMILGRIESGVDPAVGKTHAVSGEVAAMLVGARLFDTVAFPLKAQAYAVLDEYLSAHATVLKPDIWAARDVSLDGTRGLTPVVVGIWDSGSDISLFPKQLFTDPHPTTYDPHGLAFDLHGFLTHGTLYPITPERAKQYPDMVADLQALSDLQANLDTPQATALKTKLSSMNAQQTAAYFETLEYFSNYAHGTHVTGIAVHGNPAARILVGRITFDYKTIPSPPNDADVKRGDDDYQKYVDYFKAHGVRVVNMSWGGDASAYEAALEANGMGKDAATRKKMAARWFAMDKQALAKAIASAPQILFVAAAGNSNSNATFGDFIPASLNLPNLLVVGAVDQAGDAASFTSYGPTVRIFADGYQVVSTLPDGYKVPFDGTSMASPAVTNLAGKLFALDPKLTPQAAIRLIVKGATRSADGKRPLLDEQASVTLLEAQLTGHR